MDADLRRYGLGRADILLPRPGVDLAAWAVVACDQHSSSPGYWDEVAGRVGDEPSTLRLIYPEARLDDGVERVPGIHAAMEAYLAGGILMPATHGMVYVERATTAAPCRRGLVAAVDLECYDYAVGSASLIRPTEGTIAARIPPRVRIRSGAPVELPHVMILFDDPADALMGPLTVRRGALRPLYDTPLMMGGGHVRGWAVEEACDFAAMAAALEGLFAAAEARSVPPMLWAVGDGNHSLATAKACWEAIKPSIPPASRADHPGRYALVELVNLHDPGLAFHPIHRVLFGVDPDALDEAFVMWCVSQGLRADAGPWAAGTGGIPLCATLSEAGTGAWMVDAVYPGLPLALLQRFLDEFLSVAQGVRIDYIHGDDEAAALGRSPGNVALLLEPMAKQELFPAVLAGGVLPRKAFSMGEADEKRYYMEARKLT